MRILLLASAIGLFLPFLNPVLVDYPGNTAWLVDLAAHWQWLFAAGALLCAATAMIVRRIWGLGGFLCLLPWLTATPVLPVAKAGPALAVATFNVHLDTRRLERLAPWLAAEKPDIVVLLEVSPALAKELQSLKDYPHQVLHPENSPFGMALLSRLPVISSAVVSDIDDIAHLEADVQFAGRVIGVTAFHPMPPLSAVLHERRNRQFRTLLEQCKNRQLPCVMAGDFNASPWSQAMQALAGSGWARASSLRPSWPQWGLGVIGIPIDQVLASPDWGLEESRVGADLGSDHLPVLVRLRLNRL